MEGLVVLAVLIGCGGVLGIILGVIAFGSTLRLARQVEEQKQDLQRLRRQLAADWESRAAAAAAPSAVPPPAVSPPPAALPPAAVAAPAAASIPPPAIVEPAPAAPVPAPAAPVSAATAPVAAPSPAPAQPAPPRPRAPAKDFENIVGQRWLTWSGIGLVFLAAVFFLKYAYDQDWLGRIISPPVRIAGLAAVALAMVVAGLRVLRAMPALGQGLAGGAVALAYLAIYAGHAPALMLVPEPLFGGGTAFVLMALVSAAGIALAVRHDALAMAVCATVGGLATPILCSTGGGSREGLFTYLLLLDLGVLGAAWWRRWRALDLLAFAGTAVLYIGWCHGRMPAGEEPWGMLAWLGIFHAVFLALPFAHHWRTRSVVTVERFGLALGNLAFTLAYAAVLLRDGHQPALALCCLGLAALYAGIGAATRRRVGEDLRVVHGFLGLGAMLLTLGLLYLLPVEAVATAWAVEAAVLLALGYRFAHRPTRLIAHLVLACAVARLAWELLPPVALDDPGDWRTARFIVNGWLLALLVAPLGAAACALVHRRLGRDGEAARLQAACWWAAGLLLLLAGSAEILRDRIANPGGWSLLPPASALAWWWAACAAAFLLAARRWASPATVPLPALVAVGGALLGLAAYAADRWSATLPFLNPRFPAPILAAAVLAAGWRLLRITPAARPPGSALALWAAAGVVLIACTCEPAAWCHERIADRALGERLATFSVTVTWLVLASAALWLGFRQRLRPVRYCALGLFALTAGKLLLVDMHGVQQLYRILAFLLTGVVLLAASYVYHRLERRLAADVERSPPSA